jgi:predicted DNA-binding transcriptional regulator AlpA
LESIVFRYSSPHHQSLADLPRVFFLQVFLQTFQSCFVRLVSDGFRQRACATKSHAVTIKDMTTQIKSCTQIPLKQREEASATNRSPVTVEGMTNQTSTPTLVDLTEIMLLTGLGRTAAYTLTRRPDFPTPYVLSSKTVRWEIAEVSAWLDSCKGRNNPRNNSYIKKATKNPARKMKINGVNFRRNTESELS